MRYGMMLDVAAPLPDVIGQVRRCAVAGVDSALITNVTGHYDALTVLALAGSAVPGIELVTGVVPIFPHHPVWLAAQALTVQAATGGRLTLGIGLSHRFVAEGIFGFPFDRPALRMREHLDVLVPLMAGGQVAFRGETIQACPLGPLDVAAPAPPVLVAAHGPRMLALAGSVASGSITWMAGPRTLAGHVAPSVRRAADRAGRPAPTVHVVVPLCVTDDHAAARTEAASVFSIYDGFPSYRGMAEREGVASTADLAVIGDEDAIVDRLAGYEQAGATAVTASPFGSAEDRARTLALLGRLAAARTPVPAPHAPPGDQVSSQPAPIGGT